MIKKIHLLMLLQLKDIGNKSILKLYKNIKENNLNYLDINDYIGLIEEILNKTYTKHEIENSIIKSEKILEECYLNKIKIYSFLDEDYPKRFKDIGADKPVILYSKGNQKILEKGYNIAIIGSRNPSKIGYIKGYNISKELAKIRVNIISGLALGCDSAGHRGAIKAYKINKKSGKTLAALPSGINNIYPKNNKRLKDEILDAKGCIISEKPPWQEPNKYDYILRDRLQAALSEIILVIESSLKSGTVYTTNYGIKYQKELICLGDNLDKKGRELNKKLIKQGLAKKIDSTENFVKNILKERKILNEISY